MEARSSDGRCTRCFKLIETTGGSCMDCGWPLYNVFKNGQIIIYRPINHPLTQDISNESIRYVFSTKAT